MRPDFTKWYVWHSNTIRCPKKSNLLADFGNGQPVFGEMVLSDRKTQLIEMLTEQPGDDFLRYALAMEHAKHKDVESALKLYDELMQQESPYVPAFFMAGQLLAQEGESERAVPILESGVAEAERQGNAHAAGEMREYIAIIS